jgi:VIT1/CCC1 family predicted Fe2+/Mn2+ transporter
VNTHQEEVIVDKPGVLLMFLGAILIAILLFVNLKFTLWVTLFLASIAIAAVGAVLAIIDLAKKIKQEKMNK